MKTRSFALVMMLVCIFSFMAFAEYSTGKLNIITDMDDASIYIDGQQEGVSYLRNFEIAAGSHYLTVYRNNKKIYAETFEVYPGEVKTIPTSHFVDIRTSTPNRGALDVEAARIKETRGSGAFGVFMGTPLASPKAGLSVKWWFMGPFGAQLLASAMGDSSQQETQFGGRMLYSLGTKIMFEQPLEAYAALGAGRKVFDDKTSQNKGYTANVLEFALGLEFGIGNIFFSLEGGMDSTIKDTETVYGMKASGGIHYYF
jgi:hypothetical protein